MITTHLLYDDEYRYLDLIDISDAMLVRPIYMFVPDGVTHSFSVHDKNGEILRIYHVSGGDKSKVDLDEKSYILNKKIYGGDNFTINDLSFQAAFFIFYNQTQYSVDELVEYLDKFEYDDAMYIYHMWTIFAYKYNCGKYNANGFFRKTKHILYGKEISDKAEEYYKYLNDTDNCDNEYDALTKELMHVSLSNNDDYYFVVEKIKNCDIIQQYVIIKYYQRTHVTSALIIKQPYRDITLEFKHITKYIYAKLLRLE